MPGVVINMRGLFDRIRIFLRILLPSAVLFVAAVANAVAGPYEDALPGLTTDSYSDTAAALDQVSGSGSDLAAPLLQALKDQRLQFSAVEKKVLIKTADGKLLDAATGQPFAGTPPADLSNVRLNNRLRNLLDAALGSLTLMAADPNKRYDAAQSVFKSRDAATMPVLEKALAAEQNARVKAALMQAKAAIVVVTADAPAADKVAAIAVLRDRGDQDAMALLQTIPANAPPDVLEPPPVADPAFAEPPPSPEPERESVR